MNTSVLLKEDKNMATNIVQTFRYHGQSVRAMIIEEEIWWSTKDISAILGQTIDADKLDYDEIKLFRLHSAPSTDLSDIEVFISESALYKALLDKSETNKFLNWLSKEALPIVRDRARQISKAFAKDLKVCKTAKREEKKQLQAKVKQLQAQIEADRPKVRLAEAIADSNLLISIEEMADILRSGGYEITTEALYDRLRKDGFLEDNTTAKSSC